MGRVWGWVRSWGSAGVSDNTTPAINRSHSPGLSGRGAGGWTSWIWGGWKRQNEQSSPAEEYWEAQEKLPAGGKPETRVSKWWNTSYLSWPRKTQPSELRRRKRDACDCDIDGDFSDYGTPPPSPTPPSSELPSPFRVFAHSWKVEILPEHYEISFNFLRHLFDLFVVGFLWTVSPPAKLILEVLGVQGALRLWFHGMAMFFVSTVGMAGLLWLIQEYLPQFALIFGIVQALVISVSVRQSVVLGVEEEKKDYEEEGKMDEDRKNGKEAKESLESVDDQVKTM